MLRVPEKPISRKRLGCIMLLILAHVSPVQTFAQTSIETEMDWRTGQLNVLATQALGSDMLPEAHPRALATLERGLSALLINEISDLPWNRFGKLKKYIDRVPSSMDSIEQLAESLNKEWSRISEDRKVVEAFYTLNLTELLPEFFPATDKLSLPRTPVGWIPIPEDDWTGIVIYVPENTLIWGTGISLPPRPALYARILSDNLSVLFDPAKSESGFLSYHDVANRSEIDSLVGRRPYRTMARGLYGEFPCDIVLSDEDAKRILSSDSGREALSKGRVAILLDSLVK